MSPCAAGWPTGAWSAWATLPNRNVLVVAPTEEPLTRAEAKLRAGLDWPDGDPQDAQLDGFIQAARERVERDTGYALLTQTRDVYLAAVQHPIDIPAPVRPVQSITTIVGPDVPTPPVLVPPYVPPAGGEAYPLVQRYVVGWATVAEIPPALVFAVGLLTAHYATAGRDVVVVGTIAQEVPYGYLDAIADYRLVTV